MTFLFIDLLSPSVTILNCVDRLICGDCVIRDVFTWDVCGFLLYNSNALSSFAWFASIKMLNYKVRSVWWYFYAEIPSIFVDFWLL